MRVAAGDLDDLASHALWEDDLCRCGDRLLRPQAAVRAEVTNEIFTFRVGQRRRADRKGTPIFLDRDGIVFVGESLPPKRLRSLR